MAFPLLLFLIALSATVGDRLNDITFGGLLYPGVFSLVLVITLFSWFYPARIIRSQVLSLREKEFVEAARMVGSSNFRIMRSHLLPHLVGTIIVYGTVTIAINILLESTLSFLGVGLPEPNASWGKLLDQAVQFYTIQPWLIVWPGLMLLIVTLSFNLLGDGLRDALDPRAIALTFPSVLRPRRVSDWGSRGPEGRLDPEVRREEGSMKRRPGLWLALTALVAGASMLGLAGCGSSSGSEQRWRRIRRKRGDPGAPGRRHRQDRAGGQHRLPRPGPGVLPVDLADRVLDLREAHQLQGRGRRPGSRDLPGGRVLAAGDLVRRPDVHLHGAAGQVQVQHRRAGDRRVVPVRAGARPEPQAGSVLRLGLPGARTSRAPRTSRASPASMCPASR